MSSRRLKPRLLLRSPPSRTSCWTLLPTRSSSSGAALLERTSHLREANLERVTFEPAEAGFVRGGAVSTAGCAPSTTVGRRSKRAAPEANPRRPAERTLGPTSGPRCRSPAFFTRTTLEQLSSPVRDAGRGWEESWRRGYTARRRDRRAGRPRRHPFEMTDEPLHCDGVQTTWREPGTRMPTIGAS
jgi:hypothetical protein